MNDTSKKADYVARARAMMKGAIQTGALVIIPLAIAASAKASVVLPAASNGCSTWDGSSGGSCSQTVSQLAPAGGLEGIGFVGDATYRRYFPGSGGMGYSGGASGDAWAKFSAFGPLRLDDSGSTCAGAGSPCDLQFFAFSYSANVEALTIPSTSTRSARLTPYYDLTFTLDGATLFTVLDGSTSLSDNWHGTISGSALIAVPAAFQAKVLALQSGSSVGKVKLDVTLSQGWDSSTQLGSPNIRFSDVSINLTSPTPEPGSIGLAFGGLAGLAVWARRRKRV